MVNAKLDPGEEADLTLVLFNAGGAAPAVSATLASRSPFLEILDGAGAFGPAVQGDTTVSVLDRFRVRALSGAPIEVPLYCDMFVAGTGYVDTVRIPLIAGDSMNLPAGPDQYGYRIYDWTDSCYERMPAYDWVELRSVGDLLAIGDDETRVLPLPAGFGPWRYYGTTYDSISICANGWVAPGWTDRCDFVNVQLPYAGSPPNTIAVMWDDLAPSLGGGVRYRNDTAGHRLIVEYDSVAYFGVAGAWDAAQFQLFDSCVATPTGDNSMLILFRTVNDHRATTVGLQNRDGSSGLTHVWNDNYPRVAAPLRPLRALRFEAAVASGTEEMPAAPRPGRVFAAPNPFRTNCRFALPGRHQVAVRIHDCTGRSVRELGPGRLEWDGRDESGRPVAPGAYFVTTAGPVPGAPHKVVRLP